jgi:hypothetical protein
MQKNNFQDTKDGKLEMENLIVIIIVGIAAGLLGRSYYKKYKRGNQCSGGCCSCSSDASSGAIPEEGDTQLRDIRKSN